MAIIDHEHLKDVLKINDTDTSKDDFLDECANRAQSIIEGPSVCNRAFESTAYSEYYNGNGENLLFLKQYPITAITSITIGDDAVDNVDDTDYVRYNPNNGGLYLMSGVFTEGFQNVLVVYTAGYSEVNMPDSVVQACIELALIIYEDSNVGDSRHGKSSKSLPEGASLNFLHKINSQTFKAMRALRRVDL